MGKPKSINLRSKLFVIGSIICEMDAEMLKQYEKALNRGKDTETESVALIRLSKMVRKVQPYVRKVEEEYYKEYKKAWHESV